MVLLLIYVGGALAISFLCSVLEATLLSVRTVELVERSSRGDRGAALLLELKQKRLDDAIGAILTLNTIAHTVGAALAGAQAAVVFGEAWIGVFSGVLTLLVLLFTEIIPKTLGTIYASSLTGFVARTTQFLTRLLKLPLWLIGFLTRRLVSKGHKPRVSRGEIAALAASAVQHGSLDEATSKVVTNVLRLKEVRVEEVMTPRTVVVMLPETTTLAEFLKDKDAGVFSRIPIYRENRDRVAGHILQREVLAAAARGDDPATPLSAFSRESVFVAEFESVEKVLQRMIETREHMALVNDEFGGLAGLVTLEDLVETAFGVEILDETDRVSDLREEAKKVARERYEQTVPE
ncbi:MAG: CNNM domain-containing protein [Acidobacteriota bacterium]